MAKRKKHQSNFGSSRSESSFFYRFHYLFVILFPFLFLVLNLRGNEPKSLIIILHTASGENLTGPFESLNGQWAIRLGGTKPKQVEGKDVLSFRRVNTLLPAYPVEEQVILTNGDRLPGQVVEMTGERLQFRAFLGVEQEVSLPLSIVAVLWRASSDRNDTSNLLQALLRKKPKRDMIFLGNGDIIEGILTGLNRKTLQIGKDKKEVQVEFSKVAALALNTGLTRRPGSEEIQGHMVLTNGCRLTLISATANSQVLTGKTFFGADIQVPLDQIISLNLRQGRTVYLSDLKPRAYEFHPYFNEYWPYVVDGSSTGDDLVLGGNTYDKGLGMHTESRLTFELGGRYRRFEAMVGMDDRSGEEGRARIQVLVDGKPTEIRDDLEFTFQDAPRQIGINVAEAKELTLVAKFGHRGNVQGHVDWGDALLIK